VAWRIDCGRAEEFHRHSALEHSIVTEGGRAPEPDLERMPSGDPYSASLAAALLKEAGAGGRASWSHSVLSEDRRTLFTAVMGKGDISVTNALNGNQIRSFTTRPTRVTALALHPSERTLFCGYADGALREIDALTGREVRRLEGHNTWLRALAMVSSEDLLVSAGDDLALRIWDATSGVHLGTFYPDAPVRCFATTQSGDIAAGDAAGRLFVFGPGGAINHVPLVNLKIRQAQVRRLRRSKLILWHFGLPP